MRAGDIIFVRGKSPLSKIIRFFDKGKYSHVAIAISQTHIIEAQYFTKVRVVENYYKDYDILDLNLSENERSRVAVEGIQYVGKYYDYFQALWYSLRYVFNLETSQIWNSPNSMICSELIDLLLYDVGVVREHKYIGNLTPNELYRHLFRLTQDNA